MKNDSVLTRFLFSPTFFDEKAVQAVRVQFGAKGELTAVKLLCEAAAVGYVLPWTEEVRQRLLKALPGVSYHLLQMIVRELVRCGMFDRRTFEKGGVLSAPSLSFSYPVFPSPLPSAGDVRMKGKLRTLRPINGINSEETRVISEEIHVNSGKTAVNSELSGDNSELSRNYSELFRINVELDHNNSEQCHNIPELFRNNSELFRKNTELSVKTENSPQNSYDHGTIKERS